MSVYWLASAGPPCSSSPSFSNIHLLWLISTLPCFKLQVQSLHVFLTSYKHLLPPDLQDLPSNFFFFLVECLRPLPPISFRLGLSPPTDADIVVTARSTNECRGLKPGATRVECIYAHRSGTVFPEPVVWDSWQVTCQIPTKLPHGAS